LLLILVLLLMLDLAQDGFLGKATFDLPHASAKTAVSTPHHNGSCQHNCQHKFAPATLWELSSQANFQPRPFRVKPTLKIIDYHNTGSSGGIPF
jgi:hypothetical protein